MLLTVKQAAQILSISVPKLYHHMSQGDLPSVKIGKSRRITQQALDEFIQRCTVHAKDEKGEA